jgi:hypothetical protein
MRDTIKTRDGTQVYKVRDEDGTPIRARFDGGHIV